jgi:uncharacterized protein (DUF924 family)
MDYQNIINFWFQELTPKQWFFKDPEVDQKIALRFTDLITKASQGELFSWRSSPEGRLAEILLLDQFPRNIYRNRPQAFATDSLALILAQEMVLLKIDMKLAIPYRAFVYMPYMHSESPLIHQEAIKLFAQEGLEENYNFEIKHKEIIDRFGRYPHRNNTLNRSSTPEEIEFLKTHSGF